MSAVCIAAFDSIRACCDMSAVMLLEPQSVSAAMSNSDVSYAFDGSSSTEQHCHSSDSELIGASDRALLQLVQHVLSSRSKVIRDRP